MEYKIAEELREKGLAEPIADGMRITTDGRRYLMDLDDGLLC